MEIQQSIVSQALYGDKGRVAIPLNVFMKQTKAGQVGGKKDIEHLGVPLVIALVNVNMNKPCNHSYELGNPLDQNQEELSEEYDVEGLRGNSVELSSNEFEPISDEMYDTLLNTVLDEPIETEPETYNEDSPVKKYTRKNRK
jgi:hypothetical protein